MTQNLPESKVVILFCLSLIYTLKYTGKTGPTTWGFAVNQGSIWKGLRECKPKESLRESEIEFLAIKERLQPSNTSEI